eukprot:GHVT01100380.1.p4 GENE.GHVT01100380.1~~GHVT01100380.1.p4  ORF type:complete len:111 (+),score=13.78 GHVT01100380.1:1238-1570(+)
MAAPDRSSLGGSEFSKHLQRALVKHSDMNAEMRTEVIDIVTGVIDKCGTNSSVVNLEIAARMIKDNLDKYYGVQWHCVIGEGFAFDVTAQKGSLLFCFYQGNIGFLLFKC